MFRGTLIVAALVASAFGSSCDANDDAERPTDSSELETLQSSTSAPPEASVTTPTSTTSASTTSEAPRSTVAPETLASTTTTTVVDTTVTRPYIDDPSICVPASATETSISEFNDGLLRPFALSRAGWHRFQVIADPELGADGHWALVGTIPATTGFDSDNWNAAESEQQHYDTINGWSVAITTAPSGYTVASIDLGGETDAYVRTYRFDLESIRALISELALRPPEDPIGFEYSRTDALTGLEMVLDRGDEPVDAHIAVLECVVKDQAIVRIASITGDALAQYVVILDQPYPADIGRLGDAVVSIVDFGRLDSPPRVSDVSNAPDDAWARLLGQPPPSQGPTDNDS